MFYPISKDHLCTVTFGLMYGLYLRAASNQEWPMMARVWYMTIWRPTNDYLIYTVEKRLLECQSSIKIIWFEQTFNVWIFPQNGWSLLMGQWMDVIGENKTECKLCSSNHLGPWKSCSVGVRTSLPCAWIGNPMLWRRLKTLLGVQNSLLCMNRTKARFFEIGDRLVEMCRNFSPVLSKWIKKISVSRAGLL